MTKPRWAEGLIETLKTVALVLVVALVPRTVFSQPFTIPSESMEPTLMVGDYILVSKYPYGWSRHSIPLSPPIGHGRLMDKAPVRGDIVVFKKPGDGRTDVIKRVIGLPGDRIQMMGGVLRINGAPVRQTLTGVDAEGSPGDYPIPVRHLRETLPNGRTYATNSFGADTPAANTGVYTVPAGCYFVMGDNRDNSADSRFNPGSTPKGYASCAWDVARDVALPPELGMGFIPAENLVGRAERILFSWTGHGLRLDRTFRKLPAPTVG
ncbi:signal peptidase I [Caulobacter sp. RL271]|uniref:Signal peptidase I n=1 Tax=Caulobacter segnis TaxID=88688 RepID=A0ABY4ZLR3_9CAUL|nr:signal peptidase I [Caulobacter segnis]USQ93737.1 signal peptidase I [Caulobacter segnis]